MASVLEFSSTVPQQNQLTPVHHCRECSYVTTSPLLLQNHISRHKAILEQFTCFKSQLELFYCQICDFKTFFTRNFIEHVQRHKQNNFKIPDNSLFSFDIESNRPQALQEHVHYRRTIEGQITWFTCTECPYRTEWKENLKSHILQNHTPDEDIKWHECDLCPAKFKQKAVLKKHKKNIHKCGVALSYNSVSIKTEDDLQQHVPEEEWFQCDECSFKTKAITELQSHVTYFKHSVKKPQFNPQTSLKNNRNIIKSVSQDGKRFRCDECSLEFELRRNLGRHITLKHNNKWYYCTECAYKCMYSSSLKKHIMRIHATPEDPRWLRCTECAYKCVYIGSLKTHMRTHTLAEDPRRFHCTECDYKSKDKSHLRTHIETRHTPPEEIRWLHCTECSYRGKSRSNLKSHVMMKHTAPEDAKWFQCTECAYKSKNRTNLNSHIMSKHAPEGDARWLALQKLPS